jgi:teichuronic acid biosynthesis glycosyltransferase TuaC
MKRILIFSLAYHPFIGGAEVAIKEITDRISPDDIEFHLLTMRWNSDLPRTEQMGNVLVHRMGLGKPGATTPDLWSYPLAFNKYIYQLWAPMVALRVHREYKFDAIWAMMAHACGIPAGIFKFFQPEVPYLLTLQEGDPPEYLEKLMRPVWPLFKQGFTKADAMQPISTFLQQWGMRMGFKGPSEVIPNAVNVAKFSHEYSSDQLAKMKEKLGKKDGNVFIVTTSRLVHKNGIDDVIRALPLLPENISFLIYGIGPDEDKLRALAKELNVESRTRFMGQIGHEEMPLMLASCDIFTRPSRSEGMGNSFIEAMAAKLPVIATQEGGIADFLFDEKRNPGKPMTGWAVDKDAPKQIAEAVKDILARPEKVAEVEKTAAAMVQEKYDWDTIALAMKKLFDTLLKDTKG